MLYGAWFGDHQHDENRALFKTAHCKELFPCRRGTAGRNIDSVGKNSPVRMWRAGRSPMLTGGTIDSNPSLSTRSNLVTRSSREKGERPEAGQRSPSGCALGRWTLTRVFNPLSENQPHETPYFPAYGHEGKCEEREILRSLSLCSHKRSPRSGNEHHLLSAFFMGCDVADSCPRYPNSYRIRPSFSPLWRKCSEHRLRVSGAISCLEKTNQSNLKKQNCNSDNYLQYR